jgi:AbrB family looped-hinge helix DNA binding protein
METKVSTKGQVVLPVQVRRKLGLRTGDPLDTKVEGGRIVLTPRRARSGKVSIVVDPVTGLPVLSAGPNAPELSSKQVREILAEFP